jgi:thiol-disulfide isomerase/thioredoxin
VVLVLAFCRHRIVWMAVPVLFAGLFGYALHRTLHGHSCGCFGALWEPPKGFSVVMDAAFVLLGLALARWHGLRAGGMIAVVVVSLAAAGAGYFYAANTAPPTPATTASPDAAAPTHTTQPTPPKTSDPVATPADPPANSATAPDAPANAERTAGEMLLASPMLDDIRGLTDDDAAWYIFVWDPTCPTCEAMLPVIHHYAMIYAEEGNPVLQVRDLQKQDIAREAGIEDWRWTTSPAVVVVRGGRVIAEYGGEGAPFPDVVQERLFAGEPIDDLQRK